MPNQPHGLDSPRPRRPFAVLWLRMMACLLLLVSALPSVRAHGCDEEVTVRGALESLTIDPPRITVARQTFAFDDHTEFLDDDNNPVAASFFSIGSFVELEYCPGSGDPPFATKMKPDDNGGTGCEQEFRGFVESANPADNSLIVDGTTVLTTGQTEFLDDDNNPIAFSAFAAGVFVEVEGCENAGSFTATKIKLEDESGDDNFHSEFRGGITAIDATLQAFTVAGRLVKTSPATRFLDDNNATIAFGTFAVGDFVEVEGALLADGSVFASKVKMEDGPGTSSGEFEFRGTIGEVNGTTLVVDGRIVTTDASTTFLGRQNAPATLADFAAGDFVEVEGTVQADGSVAARKVKHEDGSILEFNLRGSFAPAEGGFTVDGVFATTTPQTRYLGFDNEPIAFGDFSSGQLVEAEGFLTGDGERVATKLKKEDGTGGAGCLQSVEFSGTLEEIDAEAMTAIVAGRVVAATASTEIKDADNNHIAFSALPVGQVVKVEGNTTDSGFVACEIKVRRTDGSGGGNGGDSSTRLRGTVTAIDETSSTFHLGEQAVLVNASTRFESRRSEDDDSTPFSFSYIAIGNYVKVRGQLLADGRFLASKVELEEENETPESGDRHAIGTVASADAGSFTLAESGAVVSYTESTLFYGFDDLAIAAANVAIGDFVDAEGPATSNGIAARKIEVRGSVIASIDPAATTLVAGGVSVIASAATEIKEASGAPIAFSDLAIGDLVKIEGTFTGATTLAAREIKRLRALSFSEPIGGFTPPDRRTDNGAPVLVAEDNTNTFGFAQLPSGAFSAASSTIFEVEASIGTNTADATRVPQFRLRNNNAGFQKGAFLAIESTDDGRYSPTTAGRSYRHYFVPAVPTGTLPSAASWTTALDLLNFGGVDNPTGEIALRGLAVRPIDASRLSVAETLAHYTFDRDSEGWISGGAAGAYTFAKAQSGINGSLDLAAQDGATFGFWTRDTRVAAQSNALYRSRFFVRASAANRADVPTFRLRLNMGSFTAGSFVAIESTGNGEESPDSNGRLYDVYFAVPGAAQPGDTLLASFDLLNFAGDAVLSPVSLDEFTLERIVIGE